MTEAVRLVSQYAFSEFGLSRLTGITFHTNKASGKVLEKAGFSVEGFLRENYRKDGRVLNGILYSLLKDGASNQFDPRLDILLSPIGQVKSTRKKIEDDFWARETASVFLREDLFSTHALEGLHSFLTPKSFFK